MPAHIGKDDVMGLQAIKGAPKDGTWFLGYSGAEKHEFSRFKETRMGKYGEGSPGYQRWLDGEIPRNSGWEYIERDSVFKWEPTHWMPLPEVPVA